MCQGDIQFFSKPHFSLSSISESFIYSLIFAFNDGVFVVFVCCVLCTDNAYVGQHNNHRSCKSHFIFMSCYSGIFMYLLTFTFYYVFYFLAFPFHVIEN